MQSLSKDNAPVAQRNGVTLLLETTMEGIVLLELLLELHLLEPPPPIKLARLGRTAAEVRKAVAVIDTRRPKI